MSLPSAAGRPCPAAIYLSRTLRNVSVLLQSVGRRRRKRGKDAARDQLPSRRRAAAAVARATLRVRPAPAVLQLAARRRMAQRPPAQPLSSSHTPSPPVSMPHQLRASPHPLLDAHRCASSARALHVRLDALQPAPLGASRAPPSTRPQRRTAATTMKARIAALRAEQPYAAHCHLRRQGAAALRRARRRGRAGRGSGVQHTSEKNGEGAGEDAGAPSEALVTCTPCRPLVAEAQVQSEIG
jgi:hypothetical protein